MSVASQAYFDWVKAGRPWKLAKPITELQTWAGDNNVTVVGTIGNDHHLTAEPPEDHTPFSATAWPVPLPGYVVTAIDLENTRGLGYAIEREAKAGRLPWLKYMNHSGRHLDSRDRDGDGVRWEVTPSSDQHVHLSIRSDWCDRSIGTFAPWEIDVGTFEEVWHTDALRNPYADNATNKTIWAETALYNIGHDTNMVASALPALTEAVKAVEAKLSTPPAPVIDYSKLAAEILRQLAQA